MGRPTDLTPNQRAIACGMWVCGMSIAAIARHLGVSATTLAWHFAKWKAALSRIEPETRADGNAVVAFHGPWVVAWEPGEWARLEAVKAARAVGTLS